MTSRPRLYRGSKLAGLAAVALFALLGYVALTAPMGSGEGFAGATGITASIGYAMFDLAGGNVPSEGFLAVFEIIDFVLVAALVGAVMLARRERDAAGRPLAATDGGRDDDERSEGGEN